MTKGPESIFPHHLFSRMNFCQLLQMCIWSEEEEGAGEEIFTRPQLLHPFMQGDPQDASAHACIRLIFRGLAMDLLPTSPFQANVGAGKCGL